MNDDSDDFLDDDDDILAVEDIPVDGPPAGTGKAPTSNVSRAPSVLEAMSPEADHREFLRDYFTRKDSAEELSTKNRFNAEFGAAASNLGNAIAGVKGDTSAFSDMAKYADKPLDRLDNEGSIVNKYMMQKYNMTASAAKQKTSEARYQEKLSRADQEKANQEKSRQERLRIAAGRQEETARHNKVIEQKGGGLPPETQAMATGLAQKNVTKLSISGTIDSLLSDFDKLSPDQQLARGREMIKTLNSFEGPDAVGAEESKRLAGFLEFAVGNFTNQNPTQFGRNMKGFVEQAVGVSNSMKKAADLNTALIEKISGRKSPLGRQYVSVEDKEKKFTAWLGSKAAKADPVKADKVRAALANMKKKK